MPKIDVLQEAKSLFIELLQSQTNASPVDLQEEVVISRPLSAAEAIGDTGRDDFPILRGKEVLMQAVYRGAIGQAFSAAKGDFHGTLGHVLKLPLDRNFERAVFIATMNAVLRYLGKIEKTVHCKDDGPKRCAACLAEWIAGQGSDMIGLVGLQPALLEALVKTLGSERVMTSDLAEAGMVRCDVKVLDGMDSSEIFERCQLVLMTGSTLVNGTINDLMENATGHETRVVFYGTTIAGTAYLIGLERWCACSM
ncbi:MAG: DUF364 domain-containing protein [Methanothrix sp.]